MSVKVQFFKCGLCAAFYLFVCLIFINVKRNFNLEEEPTGNSTAIKYEVQTPGSSIPDRIIKKNVESEVEMLRIDELKGEAIDLQVYKIWKNRRRSFFQPWIPSIIRHVLLRNIYIKFIL